jgi:hypothetical protein
MAPQFTPESRTHRLQAGLPNEPFFASPDACNSIVATGLRACKRARAVSSGDSQQPDSLEQVNRHNCRRQLLLPYARPTATVCTRGAAATAPATTTTTAAATTPPPMLDLQACALRLNAWAHGKMRNEKTINAEEDARPEPLVVFSQPTNRRLCFDHIEDESPTLTTMIMTRDSMPQAGGFPESTTGYTLSHALFLHLSTSKLFGQFI